jgi:nucleoside-diphosphate-sugar epimerase
MRANALAPELLARWCAERGVPLVYVGSSAIFAGNRKSEPYTEYDEPSPLSVYGLSKWRGEQAVRERNPKHFIVRAGWMMGGAGEDKKFVGKIVAQLRAGKRKLMAVSDKRGSPTYTLDFARNLMLLVESGLYGTRSSNPSRRRIFPSPPIGPTPSACATSSSRCSASTACRIGRSRSRTISGSSCRRCQRNEGNPAGRHPGGR